MTFEECHPEQRRRISKEYHPERIRQLAEKDQKKYIKKASTTQLRFFLFKTPPLQTSSISNYFPSPDDGRHLVRGNLFG